MGGRAPGAPPPRSANAMRIILLIYDIIAWCNIALRSMRFYCFLLQATACNPQWFSTSTQLSYLSFFSLGLQQGDFRKYIQKGIKCKIPSTSIEEDAKQEEKGRPIMLNMDSALNGCNWLTTNQCQKDLICKISKEGGRIKTLQDIIIARNYRFC